MCSLWCAWTTLGGTRNLPLSISKVLIIIILRLLHILVYNFVHSALGHAVPTVVFPWHSSVMMMCCNAFVYGMLNGSFHATSNVLLLQIWRGRECSPYM